MTDDQRVLSIRYDGLDGDHGRIDLDKLGQSLQGFARVLAVCAHFVETGKYNKQFNALSVEVYAKPVDEHHCYEVIAEIVNKAGSMGVFQGFAGITLTLVVNYVLNRNKTQEMKHLHEALLKSMDQNEETTKGLLDVLSRMADSLAPSARKATEPVGSTCRQITVQVGLTDDASRVIIDEATKTSLSDDDTHYESARAYTGIISEMDMAMKSCKVALDTDPDATRISATITDPIASTPENAYVLAMSSKTPITFTAKAEVNSNGDVVRLYISDYISEDR